jgi:N6-adenosine-specific RNA methylase IME4
MKYQLIIADPPWMFDDKLTMADVKRGASSNYPVLNVNELKKLDVKSISDDNAILALWVPSSMIPEGLEVMEAWGFDFKQVNIWVKTKKEPLRVILKEALKLIKTESLKDILKKVFTSFDMENVLAFGMGHLFRQTHEIALIGVRGKVYDKLNNKSQRSVHFHPATKHSVKPERLHEMFELMFPEANKLEMFARRNREGWHCIGNQSPTTFDEDIRDTIQKLKEETFIDEKTVD